MLNPMLSHLIELPLRPTPEQELTLLRLSAAHRSAELLAMDQAFLALSSNDVALSALVGGPDHPDRSNAGEAAALAATPLFSGCPASTLEYAISSYRSRLRRCTVQNFGDLPQVSASRIVAGQDVVTLAGPGALNVDGVGRMRADLEQLPPWALEALERGSEPAHEESTSEQIEILYSGWGYVEREWVDGRWAWTVELDFGETW
ncbi:hypothetical protein [Deinococcus marmoris]|uniref:hypothetical protein n=1 Tax=Deinococcus marmoris TaxID=249408 RepID=UPI000497B2DC|nr:hypothetical protein [Deinococcus marmoris]